MEKERPAWLKEALYLLFDKKETYRAVYAILKRNYPDKYPSMPTIVNHIKKSGRYKEWKQKDSEWRPAAISYVRDEKLPHDDIAKLMVERFPYVFENLTQKQVVDKFRNYVYTTAEYQTCADTKEYKRKSNAPVKTYTTPKKRICPICGKKYKAYNDISRACSTVCSAELSAMKEASICSCCVNSTGFCSWSENFEPVKGWQAEETFIISDNQSSYKVIDCPLFKNRLGWTIAEINEVMS